MKKSLYASLASCKKEEEVKAEFCKFFKMKIKALGNIDHYTEPVLFEFKYDRNFKSVANVATVLAQVMYYARKLKFGAGLAADELAALKSAHDALRAKLLPQVYSLGFLNPDVEYFE